MKVCDKEGDGHDNTKGCTTHYINSKKDYRYITVCESVWGPDWCRQPVVYMR
ncbi:hypothetical protein [Actinomadura sp. 6N118]|uniref:hypothetical protein n=1 Tax=Actinomadura sp. 6N118 TaxID=3375151 RepID=UPI0037B54F0B